MNAADPQGSPSDRGGGSSCTPPSSDRGGGSSSTPPGAGSQPEVIEVDDCKAVLVITPALVYDMKGEVYALPADIVQAIHQFTVPEGYRREGSRERWFMYSPGVYVVPLVEEDDKHMYFCLADPTCRKNKTTVPCKKGDHTNVNTHDKSTKLYDCVVYVGDIQNHTRSIYPTKNFCMLCMTFIPVPETSVSSV